MDTSITKESEDQFIEDVAYAFSMQRCELFVGSGISTDSGVTSWIDLLRPLAKKIGLDIDTDDDLPLIAQYIINENSGNRNIIRTSLYKEYNKKFKLNENHAAIRLMRPSVIWTTNYDCLLEQTFTNDDYVLISSDDDFLIPSAESKTKIIKLHGSIDRTLDHCTLTSWDYDQIFSRKPGLMHMIKESFFQRSMLFVGYSYKDPDIKRIVIEAMQVLNDKSQEHFMILKEPDFSKTATVDCDQEHVRFTLWLKEMKRLGIRCLLIKEFADLPKIMKKIAIKKIGNALYVTGSHVAEEKSIYNDIGKSLAKTENLILVYGQSEGASAYVFRSFFDELVMQKKDTISRIKMFSNPYSINKKYSNDPMLIPMLKKERHQLFSHVRIVLLFAGGMGTDAEIDVAEEKGCIILPVILEESDYSNDCISRVISNNYFLSELDIKAKKYKRLIEERKIITIEDVMEAVTGILK